MEGEADILDAWAREDQAVRIRFSKIGCAWALLFIPAGVTLDVLVYPDCLVWFALARLVSDLFILGILLAHFTQTGRSHIRTLTLAWLAVPQIAICYMIYLADGFGSTYYAGLNLAILGMGVVLPVTILEVTVLACLTLSLYVISGFVHSTATMDYSLVYNNIYFMLITSVISAIAVYFNRKRRFTEFSLNFELSKRNKALAELDRVKSEFFANVSHELRTPLTLILAPLERLVQEYPQLPARVTDKLELVRQNSFRLLRLVNDLLEVIRLEEGGADLDRRPLRLDTLIAGVADTMAHLAEARGIKFTNSCVDTTVWIRGDRGALEKIFFNMLSNAIKFTNEGGHVGINSSLRAGAITVTVEDTGIGISDESLSYIFGRFRQGDSSATRKYPGTGLGLALVKELTERHDGEVTMASRLDEGTTIAVSLPTLAAHEVNPNEVEKTVETEGDTARWLDLTAQQSALHVREEPSSYRVRTDEPSANDQAAATVLIVDDEPDMRRYLADLLGDEYQVRVARDGRQGLALATQYRPELIVLDLMLPEIDGLEVCRRIKGDADLRSSRIVLLTARAEEPSKLVALQNGADDFLTKPFSGVEVQTRLRNLKRAAELEGDLQRRNHELEDTVGQLRATQDKLVHSEKLNALGRLSAGLLHEINNPLNYTLAALDLAQNDPVLDDQEELKETLSDIDDGMQRIRGIVKELRAFAYPAKSEQVAFQLLPAIKAALNILAFEARDVRIDNAVEPDWIVIGSRNHITQVLVNLLSNAFKAMRAEAGQGPAQVSIAARAEGERIFVSVHDNGPGIDKEVLERIFDPFYTTAAVGEGMGMGLSVCQTIVRNHDGDLVVQSEPGAWTEFTFDLTRKLPAPGQAAVDEKRAVLG